MSLSPISKVLELKKKRQWFVRTGGDPLMVAHTGAQGYDSLSGDWKENFVLGWGVWLVIPG